ncbi:hypothetical protein [Streptomyces sp. Wb2n-11]|uniref:hypothetical protein n=1 Tax=Streptomyces sp. Wb2n-11 TaxID=1030533 RepID=UPI000B30CD53|nr:hypothetical protein [Streptomyces sp. Wb2n-11]
MAVRFAAVGVAAVLALPAPGACADERASDPTPARVSAPLSTPSPPPASSSSAPASAGEPGPGAGAFDGSKRFSAPTTAPSESLAGRPAGEGRTRPGRTPGKDAAPSGSGSATPEAAESGGASPSGSAGATHSPSASASGSASASASTSATPRTSYAPSSGEVHEEALEEPWREPAASPSSHAPPGTARKGSQQAVAQSDPLGVHVLPLGVGLSLFGLGLGFLGLRMRRG